MYRESIANMKNANLSAYSKIKIMENDLGIASANRFKPFQAAYIQDYCLSSHLSFPAYMRHIHEGHPLYDSLSDVAKRPLTYIAVRLLTGK